MGTWTIDTKSMPGVIRMTLTGQFTMTEMERFARDHDAAIFAFGGADYRVLVDLRELMPLSPEATERMAKLKLTSSSRSNFRGSAVLVSHQFTAMQHRRTSLDAGVLDTEITTSDEAEALKHLASVHRGR